MAHRNQSGAGARIVRRSVGTASLLKGGHALTGWVLPLIGQHYIGRRDPADSVTPRQQRYLAVRGGSTMLDHSAFLSWRGRTGCHMSLSPTGDRGFESWLLQQ
jgi:hypothetical protein